MIYKLAILLITLAAVTFGFFNKRWAVACSMLVLHIAIGSFIIGCASYWVKEHEQVAAQYKPYAPWKDGGEQSSVVQAVKENRG